MKQHDSEAKTFTLCEFISKYARVSAWVLDFEFALSKRSFCQVSSYVDFIKSIVGNKAGQDYCLTNYSRE